MTFALHDITVDFLRGFADPLRAGTIFNAVSLVSYLYNHFRPQLYLHRNGKVGFIR